MQKYISCLFIVMLALAIQISPCQAQTSTMAQTSTIAIAPFSVTSESGLDYLETGMIDLFSSRLALPGKVNIVDKAKVLDIFKNGEGNPKSRISDLALQTQADYVLTGTLTESVQGIEIHTVVIDPKDMKPVLDLKESSGDYESADIVIPLVDLIAGKINQTLFSRNVPQETVEQKKDVPYNIHAHPDTLLEFVPKEK